MIAVLVVGMFATVDIQRANADNSNGDDNKSCNGHNSETTKCSHKDSTPFMLPFP